MSEELTAEAKEGCSLYSVWRFILDFFQHLLEIRIETLNALR